MWSHYENAHEGHKIKPIPIAIDLARTEKKQLVDEGLEVSNILETSISQYQQLQESMTRQKYLYLKKLDAEFDLILKLVELRKQTLTDKINKAYSTWISENSKI